MGGILRFAYVMAIGRAVSSWRLEAVLFSGILLAVALMASGVIFSELLANAALRDALSRSEPKDVNLKVRTFSSQDDPPDVEGRSAAFRARDEYVRQNIQEPFGNYLADHTRLIKSATFFFRGLPHLELDNDTRPRGSVMHMAGLEDRARVLEGEWPAAPAPSGPDSADSANAGEPLPVSVDEFGAQLLGMGVGDVMEIFPASLFDDLPPIEVRIAAIFEVLDPSDPIWYDLEGPQGSDRVNAGGGNGRGPAFSRQDENWTLVHLFASEEALLGRVLGSYPSIYADATWYFIPDHGKIHASETVEIQRQLGQIEWLVTSGLQNSGYTIRLDDLLRDFERQLLLAQVPLLLMLFLVVAILIYYLALIAGLIVRSRSAEISLLKSRGATPQQIAILGLGEGLIVAIPAVIAGPYVALGLIKLLGFVFFRLSGTTGEAANVPVGVSLDSFLIGIAGGILAVVVFTATTLLASRRGGVEARQASSRPPTSNFFQRYYLDLALLAVIGLLWWQLQSRGAFLVQSLGSSELSIDYSLMAGPVLGLVAAGLIVLRVFPWATALLATGLNTRWAGPFAPSWLLHVLRHLSRDPLTPAMLIVLVMLATALGVIGSSFSATLERGQREQALYEAGADLRLRFASLDPSVCRQIAPSVPSDEASDGPRYCGAAQVVADLEEVEAATDGYRSSAFLTTTGFSTSGALLALQSGSISDTAWFREDFATGLAADDLSRVLDPGAIGPVESDGLMLPPDATELVLWSRAGGSSPYLGVWVRLQDGKGQIIDAWMGDLEQPVWTRLSLPLTEEGFRGNTPDWRWRPLNAQPPYRLLSFSVRSRLGEDEGGAIFFGRVDAVLKAGTRHVGALCRQSDGVCETLVHDFRSLRAQSGGQAGSTGAPPPDPGGGGADWGWRVIEDFRKPGLHSLESSGSAADVVRLERGDAGAGPDSVTRFDDTARFSFSSGSVGRTGIRAGGPDEPVPALASSRFLEVADVAVGETAILGMSNHSFLLEIAGELEYFPTLDPSEEPFVVMDLARFNRAGIRHNPVPPQGPNELWIALTPGNSGTEGRTAGAGPAQAADASGLEIVGALRDAGVTVRDQHDAQLMVASRLDRPLVNAGWGALLVLLFLAITLASASGLLLFSHLDANERQTEFALLRTLGISRGQMLTILWAGLSIMVLSGVALGTLLGWLLGASLLPLMEVAEAGERITPSLVFTADWERLLISYAVLAAVALFSGLWLAWLTGRLQLHQVLRMGE